jgi:hypothetical protein
VPNQAPTAAVASDSDTQDMAQRQRGDSGVCLNLSIAQAKRRG